MNILYALLYLLLLAGLVWLSFYLAGKASDVKNGKTGFADEEAAVLRAGLTIGRYASLTAAILLALIFVNNFVVRIPNPFEPSAASFDGLSRSRESAGPTGPLTIPPTNADPAAAAAREKDLLDEAKRQQPANLNK